MFEAQRIKVKKFGPIDDIDIEIRNILLFVGPQASGKSTIAKLIFFFFHTRDVVIEYLYEKATSQQTEGKNLHKKLSKRFVEFFGPSFRQPEEEVEFTYKTDYFIKVNPDSNFNKYTNIIFSHQMWQDILSLEKEVLNNFRFQKQTG
ncbi:MAG: AAA family ATPase, partial [Firmicutes bacterium]|nr:AAA family ATPase [Bacillota bacterium]